MNKHYFYTLAVLFLPIVILYSGSLNYDFIAIDDAGQLHQNPKVLNWSWSNIVEIFSSETIGMYQPLTSLFFSLLGALFGFKSALTFHLFSLSLHLANTLLVFLLGKHLFNNKQKAMLLAFLFGLHPLAVESVAWISATSTVLFSFFFLAATLAYCNFLKSNKNSWIQISLLMFVMGAFCKVQILPFVAVLFLIDVLNGLPLFEKKRLVQKIPFVGVAVVFGLIALHFRGGHSGISHENYKALYLLPSQLFWYIHKTFVPLNLGIVYDWPLQLGETNYYLSCFFLVAIAVAFYYLRNNRLFVFGLLFYLCNILLHTAAFSEFLGPFSDRYAYISTLGIWIAALSLISDKRNAALKYFVLVAVYAFLAKAQLKTWESTIALWTNNLTHETATFSNGMRGNLYYEDNKLALAKADFEKVDQQPDARLNPDKYNYLYTALGVMESKADKKKSVAYFLKAATISPEVPNFVNLATAYQAIQVYDKAEALLLQCNAKKPNNKDIYIKLSALYFESKQHDKAVRLLNKVIDLGFNDILFYKFRAYFQIALGNVEKAEEDIQVAIKMDKKVNNGIVKDEQLRSLIQNLQYLKKNTKK